MGKESYITLGMAVALRLPLLVTLLVVRKQALCGDGPHHLGPVNLTIYQLLNQPITITANDTNGRPVWYQILHPKEKKKIRFRQNKTFSRSDNKTSVKVNQMSMELDHTCIVYSIQTINSGTALIRSGGINLPRAGETETWTKVLEGVQSNTTCLKSTGTPQATFALTKFTSKNTQPYEIPMDEDKYKVVSGCLLIEPLNPNDTGSYDFHAVNCFGSTVTRLNIVVECTEVPDVTIINYGKLVARNGQLVATLVARSQLQIFYNITGYPVATVKLYHDFELVPNSTRSPYTRWYLKLDNVSISDSGEYHLEAKNVRGSAKVKFFLTVTTYSMEPDYTPAANQTQQPTKQVSVNTAIPQLTKAQGIPLWAVLLIVSLGIIVSVLFGFGYKYRHHVSCYVNLCLKRNGELHRSYGLWHVKVEATTSHHNVNDHIGPEDEVNSLRSSRYSQGAEETGSSHQLTDRLRPCNGNELQDAPYYTTVSASNEAGLSAILESDYCKISGEYHAIEENIVGVRDIQQATPVYEVVDQIPKHWMEASPPDNASILVAKETMENNIYATVQTDSISSDHSPGYAQVDIRKKHRRTADLKRLDQPDQGSKRL